MARAAAKRNRGTGKAAGSLTAQQKRPRKKPAEKTLEWGEEPGPLYEVRSTGQKVRSVNSTCAITVIDREAKKIVGRKKAVAEGRDEVKVVADGVPPGGVLVADRPRAEVQAYLAKLPRR